MATIPWTWSTNLAVAGFLDFLNTSRPSVERSNRLLQQIAANPSQQQRPSGPTVQDLISRDMLDQMTQEDPLAEAGLRDLAPSLPAPIVLPPLPQRKPPAPTAAPATFPRRSAPPETGPWAGHQPEAVYNALEFVESSHNPTARSAAGARGLMQLMPETAAELAKRRGIEGFHTGMLSDPSLNRSFGQEYIRQQVGKFGTLELGLAGYNWGQGHLRRLIDRLGTSDYNVISKYLPDETWFHVERVKARLEGRKPPEERPQPQRTFRRQDRSG